jgi:hypothetical protein
MIESQGKVAKQRNNQHYTFIDYSHHLHKGRPINVSPIKVTLKKVLHLSVEDTKVSQC